MNDRLFILIILIQFVISINATRSVGSFKNRVITVRGNETDISCVTADGDAGICRPVDNCNVTDSIRRERLVNCGSVFRKTLNHICCPVNQTLDQTISAGFSNDVSCGRHFEFWNVVGGSSVPTHYDPWTVAIYQVVHFSVTSASNFTNQQYYRFICGGTLVSRQHVISAAHCVVQGWRTLTASDFLIKVGASKIDYTGTFMKVQNVWAHENYRSYQRYNDISMFKLSQAVRSEFGLAACLPLSNSGLKEGTPLNVAGWGSVSYLGKLSENLKEAQVDYINNAECSRNYTRLEGSSSAYPNGIDMSMICAGSRAGGVDSCQGDSGGPLMYSDPNTKQVYLVGIVSFGYKCAAPGYPGIYTRVYTYLNWIINAMRR